MRGTPLHPLLIFSFIAPCICCGQVAHAAPYSFKLSKLFPGKHFRRLQATARQDAQANNGERVGDRVTLCPQEGLFLALDSRAFAVVNGGAACQAFTE